MKPSGCLIEFLEANPLPWIYYDSVKGKVILIVDNHLLSTHRNCAEHFRRAHVQGYFKKSPVAKTKERNWYLEFGILIHRMFELYYREFKKPGFDITDWAVQRATAEWQEMHMDAFGSHKEFVLIGGLKGFIGLLIQYGVTFSAENEHLRVLGTEVSFGRNLEVPIYIGEYFEIYLAGRMDLIVDDGYFIMPMDHKTKGTLRPGVDMDYTNDEGPTGYVFSLGTVLKQFIPEDQILKRDCSKILMNLISKKPESNPAARFKRFPLRKTQYQLIKYQERMIASGEELLADMERIASDIAVKRNTAVCRNWMHFECPYFDVCRQGSFEAEEATLKNGYVKLPIWNTEEVGAA